MATPYALVSVDETTSTQDDARRLMGQYPTLVVARSQTSGRGRSGAGWLTAPSALAVSLAFRPSWPERDWPRLTLVAGVAAAAALGGDVELKWPNDVVRAGRKLGGILTEVSDGVAVVGWGCNLYWPDAPDGVGAVFAEAVGDAKTTKIAQRWAEQLLAVAAAPSDGWPIDEYRALCGTLGRQITWQPDGGGTAIDIAPDGSLVVDSEQGRTNLTAGAVTEIRPA